jgi:hypothetical protein
VKEQVDVSDTDTVIAGCDAEFDAVLAGMKLRRFEFPKPKMNGNISLLEVLHNRCLATLADMADEYVPQGSVAFGFADHREFNAFAHRASRDMICLYVPAVKTLWAFFHGLMGQRELFPWIDDTGRFEGEPPQSKGDLFFVRPPNNPSNQEVEIRRQLAVALFDTVLDFMLKRQVAHLWQGHVDLLHAKKPDAVFQEMRLVDGGLDISTVQTLHYNADSYAIQQAFARAHRLNPFAEFAEGFMKDHKIPVDGVHSTSWYFTWFAIYASFRLFDESCEVAELPQWTHPPAALRQACLVSAVAAVCARQGWSKLNPMEWERIASDAGLEAERLICRLRGFELNPSAYMSFWNEPVVDQMQNYMQVWETLGPQLAAMPKGPRAAQV